MITYDKMTTEEALRRCFKENPDSIGKALSCSDATTFTVTFTLQFPVPGKYAKAIVKDYLTETLNADVEVPT